MYQKQKWEGLSGEYINPAVDNYQKISTQDKLCIALLDPEDKNICVKRKNI